MAQAHVIPQAITRAAPQPDWTIGVVGGLEPTGRALVQAALRCGFHVRIVHAHRGAAERAHAAIATELGGLAARAKLNGASRTAMLGRLRTCSSVGELGGASLVVDASTDETGGKLAILRDLDTALGPDTVLLTHTSGASVTKLAAATKHPERVVGLHWMRPAATATSVEVVRTLQTSDVAYDDACRFVRALGKTLLRVKDFPGFLVHRLHLPMINEACFVLEEGVASLEDIDAAAPLGERGMGPLRLADEIGLDTCLFATERLHREFGDGKYRPAPVLRNYVAAGWLGRKTGRGFYTYA
jgi:3-hydroxybutyryl-CoA dehydrogenase